MKRPVLIGVFLISFLTELVILLLFLLPGTENPQDTVAVNEVLQTVQRDWDSLEEHTPHPAFD